MICEIFALNLMIFHNRRHKIEFKVKSVNTMLVVVDTYLVLSICCFFKLIIFSLGFEISLWVLNFARIIIYKKHEIEDQWWMNWQWVIRKLFAFCSNPHGCSFFLFFLSHIPSVSSVVILLKKDKNYYRMYIYISTLVGQMFCITKQGELKKEM